jgi:hypothetical protein
MVALFKKENEVSLHPHQPLSAGGAIDIGIDQLLQLDGPEGGCPAGFGRCSALSG